MAQAGKKSTRPPAASPSASNAGDEMPPVVEREKHPWLLALTTLLVLGWMGFLVLMAVAE